MSKRKPIDPKDLKVGDIVEWVERPDVWDVEVLEIADFGIFVDAGYGKRALFAPSSEGDGKYIRLVGTMEMDDYLRHQKAKPQSIEPEKFVVGETVEWVESDGIIWDETVLEVNGDEVTVSCSWSKRVFAPVPGGDGRHRLVREGDPETNEYIRHPKKAKKDKKKKK